MAKNEFKVVFSKKDLIAFLCCFFGIMFFIILCFFISDDFLLNTIAAICFCLLSSFTVLSSLLFCVKVNGSNIKVRTRIGRKYQFNVSDIVKVFCSKSSTKYGSSFYITIVTKSRELEIGNTMLGFERMAGYILEKFENGEINSRAISRQNQKELLRYKNGEIYKKSAIKNKGRKQDL